MVYPPHPMSNILGNGSSLSLLLFLHLLFCRSKHSMGGRKEPGFSLVHSLSTSLSVSPPLPPIEPRTNVARCFASGETVHGLMISLESIQNSLFHVEFSFIVTWELSQWIFPKVKNTTKKIATCRNPKITPVSGRLVSWGWISSNVIESVWRSESVRQAAAVAVSLLCRFWNLDA